MTTRNSTQKLAAALALLAMALNVGWPLIADAASRDASPSARFEQAMQMDENHCGTMPGAIPSNGHGSPHCAFCTLMGDKTPLIVSTGVRNAGVLIVDLVALPADLAALPQSPSYPAAQPRAPPFPV